MLTAVSVADKEKEKEKDAFFVVRKGDVIGIYKDLNDCQAQVGSSVNTIFSPLQYILCYLYRMGIINRRNYCVILLILVGV